MLKLQNKKKQVIEHSPTLNTVIMVEEILKKSREIMTIAELKRKLPRKVMHQTLIKIIDYLQYNGRIIIGTKGILWIYADRKKLEMLISRGTEVSRTTGQ